MSSVTRLPNTPLPNAQSPTPQTGPIPRWRLWTGYGISVFCGLFLIMDAVMKLMQADVVREAMTRLGYPANATVPLGVLLLTCTVLYLIPRTSILGAVLLTGYLGGATTTHVRVGDPFWFPVVFGMLLWAGLWLRDAHVRAVMPVRR